MLSLGLGLRLVSVFCLIGGLTSYLLFQSVGFTYILVA